MINETTIQQFLIQTSGHLHAPHLRLVLGGVGAAVVISVLAGLRRGRSLPAVFLGLLAGALLLAPALDPEVLVWVAHTPYLTRIRFLMGLLSAVVLMVTLESIRRSRLHERYALLWVATGLIILLSAFFPQVLYVFSRFFGMQYVTAVVAVVFTFLILVVFHFSIAMSRFQDNQSRLAQRLALLEQDVKRLKQERPQ